MSVPIARLALLKKRHVHRIEIGSLYKHIAFYGTHKTYEVVDWHRNPCATTYMVRQGVCLVQINNNSNICWELVDVLKSDSYQVIK